MDEQSAKNELHNLGQIQGLNLDIHNSPITQNFYNSPDLQFWNTLLCPIQELRLESFKLGDDAAANFPYIIDPIKEAYSEMVRALQVASNPINRVKRGILLLGESNAGKTRLALEALKQVLPTWSLLRWQPYYSAAHIPPVQVLEKQPLVLFLDDLHEYVLSLPLAVNADNNPGGMPLPIGNSCVMVLRALLEVLFQRSSNVVIVATCRSENQGAVYAELGSHLLVKLQEICFPSFGSGSDYPQVEQVIAAFQQKGEIHRDEWDGTLGSLVLGLSRKHQQYKSLPQSAQAVLQALKLLAMALVSAYSEQRVRRICIEVFPKAKGLQDDGLWQEVIDLLLRTQFVREDYDEPAQAATLAIRKDSYLDKVISDYPPEHHPVRLQQDLTTLLEILLDLNDAEALFGISSYFIIYEKYEKALEAINSVLASNADDPVSLTNKGLCLRQLGRTEDALTVLEQAIKLYDKNIAAWGNRGLCYEVLEQYEKALESYDYILSLAPDAALFWERKGLCHARLKQYEQSVEALDQFLSLGAGSSAIWVLKGNSLLQLQRYSEAIDAFEQALTVNPKDAAAWYAKGLCLEKLKRPSEAVEAIGQFLIIKPDDVDAWQLMGPNLAKLGRFQEALQAFEKALTLNASESGLWSDKGTCLDDMGRHEEAIQAYEQALILNEKNVNALIGKANYFARTGCHEEALQTYDQALNADSANTYAMLNKGACLDQMGRRLEALALYEQILAIDPGHAAAWTNRGASLCGLERFQEGLYAFEQALAFERNNIIVWKNSIHCLIQLKQYEKALDACTEALSLDNHVSIWLQRGHCLDQLGRFEEALLAYNEVEKSDPSNVEVLISKGAALGHLEHYEEALMVFEEATNLDPMNKTIWVNRCICLEKLGRYIELLQTHIYLQHLRRVDKSQDTTNGAFQLENNQALAILQDILSYQPDHSTAWYLKGEYLNDLNRHEEAIAAFEQSLTLNPNNHAALCGKGDCLRQLGQYPKAVQIYERVLMFEPGSLGAWLGMGICLERLNRFQQAVKAYTQTLALHPHPLARAGIWNSKGLCLGKLGRHKEAMEAFEESIACDPDFATAWANKAICLQFLGNYQEAIRASKKAHMLDPIYPLIGIGGRKANQRNNYRVSSNMTTYHKSNNQKKQLHKTPLRSRKTKYKKR